MKYTEYQLEQAFIELIQAQGYVYENGKNIIRTDKKEVLLKDDLEAFLLKSHPDL